MTYNVCDEEKDYKGEGRVAQERPLAEAIQTVVLQDARVSIHLDIIILVLVNHERAPAIPQPVDVPKPGPHTTEHRQRQALSHLESIEAYLHLWEHPKALAQASSTLPEALHSMHIATM